ncbi:protein draper [Manihot esculenta]|uniref:Uncharacterized protein n=1 Tax=Manihot esculenta TaxID=3983 RepID=A0A2C9W5I8_MANES|nr:protein draper [Manihot esculenta]OAY54424.1 hypothetical protein MANES_03G073600v8 [Manihot esculenta]
MEAESTTVAREPVRHIQVGDNSSGSKAICSCGEGYTCVITRTTGPDAGKTYKCTGGCVCILGGTADEVPNLQEKLKSLGGGSAYCECGEGWTCVISKIEDPDSGKAGVECAGDCTCVTTTA